MASPMNQDLHPVSVGVLPPKHEPSEQWLQSQADRDELRHLLLDLRVRRSKIRTEWCKLTVDERSQSMTAHSPRFLTRVDALLNFLRLPISKEDEDVHIDKMAELDPSAHAILHFLTVGLFRPQSAQGEGETELNVVLFNIELYGRTVTGNDFKTQVVDIRQVMEEVKVLYEKVKTLSKNYWKGTFEQ